MSQRNSEYDRKPMDFYATPEWVTEALIPHLPRLNDTIWEPCAGDGVMVDVLKERRFKVVGTDIWPRRADIDELDFFEAESFPASHIITNPPFSKGTCDRFVEKALRMTKWTGGVVAILQRIDWDSAKGRVRFFDECPAWHKKIILTKRIVWFVEENGKPKASPSENHAWYIWDWKHRGPATLAYA